MISTPALISKQRHGVSEVADTGSSGDRGRGTTTLFSDSVEIRSSIVFGTEDFELLQTGQISAQIAEIEQF